MVRPTNLGVTTTPTINTAPRTLRGLLRLTARTGMNNHRSRGLRFRAAVATIGLTAAAVGAALPAHAATDPTAVTTKTTSVGASSKLQYCSNGRVEDSTSGITTVVIVIHGTDRNACTYASNTLKAAQASGVATSTLVVAPHFLADEDSHSGRLYWDSSGWKVGDKSHDSSRLSSFAAVDRLLANVTTQRYPKLQRVVVAGHSAGGQFVNRYQVGTAADNVSRFVVANPSSYLYFGAERFSGATLRALTPAEQASCPDFNDYKYGLRDLNSYMGATPEQTLRDRFIKRPTTLLLGTADTLRVGDLDMSCAGDWQGPNRYVRGHQYHDTYLPAEFGPEVLQMHQVSDVPAVGHSWSGMSRSVQGRMALFGR
jgi:pimeloyl-ACP methyl ester carboxylesterase